MMVLAATSTMTAQDTVEQTAASLRVTPDVVYAAMQAPHDKDGHKHQLSDFQHIPVAMRNLHNQLSNDQKRNIIKNLQDHGEVFNHRATFIQGYVNLGLFHPNLWNGMQGRLNQNVTKCEPVWASGQPKGGECKMTRDDAEKMQQAVNIFRTMKPAERAALADLMLAEDDLGTLGPAPAQGTAVSPTGNSDPGPTI
jgi:hypothetical protein